MQTTFEVRGIDLMGRFTELHLLAESVSEARTMAAHAGLRHVMIKALPSEGDDQKPPEPGKG